MINPNSISYNDFCDQYELPGDFYDILLFIKSSLNLQKKQKVVIIIDEFLRCAEESESNRKLLLSSISQFLDNQYRYSDSFESVDFIISTLEFLPIENFESTSGRAFELISLPPLLNSIVLLKKYETFVGEKTLDYLEAHGAGHPRTLQYLDKVLEDQYKIGRFDLKYLMDGVERKISEKYSFLSYSELIKAVLIRKSKDKKIIDQLVSMGI